MDVQSVLSVSDFINKYGFPVMVESLFIIIFLSIVGFFIVSNRKFQEQVLAQNKDLIEGLIKKSKEEIANEKHEMDKDLIEMFFKLSSSLKRECKNTLDVINANRTAIYIFHNGSVGMGGFHFLKFSCICEYFTRGSGSKSRMQEHANIPVSLLDDSIEELITKGNYIVYTGTDSICDCKECYVTKDRTNEIAYKILLKTEDESCIFYTIYDINNNPIGFVLSEFDNKAFNLEDLKSKREYLKHLAEKVSPILEVSTYYRYKRKLTIEDNKGDAI